MAGKLFGTKKKKFYDLIIGNDDRTGIFMAPKEMKYGFGKDVKPVENWQNIVFRLDAGSYGAYMTSNVGGRFVNEELKKLLEEHLPDGYPLEFLPMQVKSKEYGDKTYYLIHFKIIFDVIDEENSVRIAGRIAKPWIDYEKAKELDFFNSKVYSEGIMVSDKIRKLMRKNKLDADIEFLKVPYAE